MPLLSYTYCPYATSSLLITVIVFLEVLKFKLDKSLVILTVVKSPIWDIISSIEFPLVATSILKSKIENYQGRLEVTNTGTVLEVGDGISRVYGLEDAMASELVEFEDVKGT